MAISAAASRSWHKGRKTAAADTRIEFMIPPRKNLRTKLTSLEVLVGATEAILTVMSPLAQVKLNAAAAAAQAVVVLNKDPGNYSANRSPAPRTSNNLITTADYLVIETPDGTYWFVKTHASTVPVTNSDGTVTVTLASNVPTGGLLANAKVWFFGITTDTNPANAEAHQTHVLELSTRVMREAKDGASLGETLGVNEPMILSLDNATSQSYVENLDGVYGP